MNNDLENKLTAYALGELDEDQRREIEALIVTDVEAQKFVSETQAFARRMKTELKADKNFSLNAKQQARLQNLFAAKFTPRTTWQMWGVAASVLLVAGLSVLLNTYSPQKITDSEVGVAQMEVPKATLKKSKIDLSGAEGKDDSIAPKMTVPNKGLKRDFNATGQMYPGAVPPTPLPVPPQFNTEAYNYIRENVYQSVTQNPLSTFSIDVDTASYSNMRRFLNLGLLPPKDAVRIEEMINYFTYDDPAPTDSSEPFSARIEVAQSPWHEKRKLVRIGIKGKEIARENRSPSNLVFLIDTSGSMFDENKLPLLKNAIKLLVQELGENDRVSIVTYAGSSGLALPATTGDQKEKIMRAIDVMGAGGSTNGAAGIELAYQTAQANFVNGGVNRVILATDGDFNVGTTSQGDLTRLIADKAKSGVFLSVLGFGMGNYKDANMEILADKGNGNYAYIDTMNEAKKVLVEQMTGTLITIAKDVKIQVEFNPAQVSAYRLIGYENRLLKNEDFNNDKIDAGEIGAGHTVTALYEIVPAGEALALPSVDPLKYQKQSSEVPAHVASSELMTVKIRYKEPQGEESQLLAFPVQNNDQNLSEASADLRFAAAVATFGLTLRESEEKGSASFALALDLAQGSLGLDLQGYRKEFMALVKKASAMTKTVSK